MSVVESMAETLRNGAIDASGVSRASVSLRTKAIAAFVLLVLYVGFVGFMLAERHDTLRVTVEEQHRLHAVEEALARVNSALAYAILNVNDAYANPASRANVETIALDVEAVRVGLQGFVSRYPSIEPWLGRLDRGVARVRLEWGVTSLVELRDTLHKLVQQLDVITADVRNLQQTLSGNFRDAYDSISITSLVMGLIGVVVFGGIVMLFFSRLVWDLRKLRTRALEVVSGYRGNPIEVTRRDELGSLMESVNDMQSELRKRERELEIARQQRFHNDKMAAIGSLAAAIAHEVNNPIAAIAGVAEAIHDTKETLYCKGGGCQPELILEQTRRISQITRQLADMTAPYSPEPQLLELNALVRSTCGFVCFDKRFRGVELSFDLDPQLPAVKAIADHLTQVLMNLLLNAADATGGIRGGKPSIRVTTSVRGDEIVLSVEDNGCGMDEATLARAFDQAFTTKPPGKGSGLGLFMCRSLIEAEGGRITLESTPQRGTVASVYLPRPAAKG